MKTRQNYALRGLPFLSNLENRRVLYVDLKVQKKYQLQKPTRIFTKTILQIQNEKNKNETETLRMKGGAEHWFCSMKGGAEPWFCSMKGVLLDERREPWFCSATHFSLNHSFLTYPYIHASRVYLFLLKNGYNKKNHRVSL